MRIRRRRRKGRRSEAPEAEAREARAGNGNRRGLLAGLCAALLAAAAAGCSLAEVTTADPEEIVVAEVYLRVWQHGADAIALLHGTGVTATELTRGATVRVRRTGGEWTEFTNSVVRDSCLAGGVPNAWSFPECFALYGPEADTLLTPGSRLEVEVFWPGAGGGRMAGATTVPGDFEIRAPAGAPEPCRLSPGQRLPLAWTRAQGAWAYLPEALISGLGNALAGRGIPIPPDPVMLQGLSISEADTTVVFPSQFGLFERFAEGRPLLLAIQDGLPANVSAEVIVSALDRNAVNWLRGGAFNPSGVVRIPSLFGDGTGVVASLVNRNARVVVSLPGRGAGAGLADCG